MIFKNPSPVANPPMNIRTKLLAPTTLFIFALAVTVTAITCLKERRDLFKRIDEKLRMAAGLASDSVPAQYHDRIVDETSVSEDEYAAISAKYGQLCLAYGLTSLWSCMLVGDRLVFTTATSPTNRIRRKDYAAFYSVPRDPAVYDEAFKTMKTTFRSFPAEEGDVRMVVIPALDGKGRRYFFAASMSLNHANAEFWETIRSGMFLCLGIMGLGTLGCIALSASIAQPIIRLTQVADSIACGDMDQEIDLSGGSEIRSLGRSIGAMRDSIRETISKLKSEIVEHQLADETLREAEARYRLLFGQSPDGILIIDSKTANVVEFNDSAHHQLGYSREEFSALSLFDFRLSESPEQLRAWIGGLVENGAAEFDTKMRTKSGEIKHVHFTARIIPIARRPIYYCVWRDITKRKNAEEALRESEQRYRSVVEHCGVGIALISPQMEILSLNEEMRAGCAEIDLAQRPHCYKTFNAPARSEPCSYCPVTRTFADGQVHEAVTETPGGDRLRNFRLIASPIKNERGEVTAVIEMAEDITERRRMEAEILEISDYEKQRLGQDLHDDVCQALVGTALQVAVVAKGLAQNSSPEAEKLKEISRSIEQITGNVRNLARNLFPSGLSGEGFLIGLKGLTSHIEHLFRIPCSFECVAPPHLEDVKLASHLFRIAQEALHNAAKHSKGTRLALRVECDENSITLSVTDNGVGNWSLEKSEGMGMRTMQYRANEIGGVLTFDRVPGVGTRVSCSAPLARVCPPPARIQRGPKWDGELTQGTRQ